jgi:hypothetical protein
MDGRLLTRMERRQLSHGVFKFLTTHAGTARGMAERFGVNRLQVSSILLSLLLEGAVEPIGIANPSGGPGEFLWGPTVHGQFHGVQDAHGRNESCHFAGAPSRSGDVERAEAELYVAAARGNPFLAAWVSVLDTFGMPPITEVAPTDWEDAFEDLFHLGFIADEQFNAVDFKKSFRQRPPPARDVESALAELAVLRQPYQLEDCLMARDIFDKPDALAPTTSTRVDLATGGFEPLARRSNFPAEIIAPSARAASLAPLEPTRRVPELGAATRAVGAAAEEGHWSIDPRTYVEELQVEIYCCGQKCDLVFDDGRDVTVEEGAPENMVELLFHAVCPHCRSQKLLQEIRPMPAGFVPR